MKQIFIFILLVFSTFLKAQSIQEIDSLLLMAYENDQKFRTESMTLMNKLNSTGANDVPSSLIDSLMLLQEQILAIDKENQILVASILKKGLPEGLSSQSYKTIWLIVDHAGLKFQKKHLPIMEEAAQKELVSVGDFAVLKDRIRMREGKPQRYGTQSYTVTVDGQQVIYIWPVEDARMLNELRNEIGAGDIETYIQVLKATAGCDVIYDPELTVHQMKKMGLLKNMNASK
ncbi:DUF6624 domain-containing protein [Bacteroides uniformis]|jgi:hypothetical protein|uniref:DUF6624 domain-containing protein n=1 Tax=Bacteroides uniformis TaxID=820 RepID=UPI00319E2D29